MIQPVDIKSTIGEGYFVINDNLLNISASCEKLEKLFSNTNNFFTEYQGLSGDWGGMAFYTAELSAKWLQMAATVTALSSHWNGETTVFYPNVIESSEFDESLVLKFVKNNFLNRKTDADYFDVNSTGVINNNTGTSFGYSPRIEYQQTNPIPTQKKTFDYPENFTLKVCYLLKDSKTDPTKVVETEVRSFLFKKRGNDWITLSSNTNGTCPTTYCSTKLEKVDILKSYNCFSCVEQIYNLSQI